MLPPLARPDRKEDIVWIRLLLIAVFVYSLAAPPVSAVVFVPKLPPGNQFNLDGYARLRARFDELTPEEAEAILGVKPGDYRRHLDNGEPIVSRTYTIVAGGAYGVNDIPGNSRRMRWIRDGLLIDVFFVFRGGRARAGWIRSIYLPTGDEKR